MCKDAAMHKGDKNDVHKGKMECEMHKGNKKEIHEVDKKITKTIKSRWRHYDWQNIKQKVLKINK
jgi:hypothetical protein